MALDDKTLLGVASSMLAQAAGHDSDIVSEDQQRALDYYFMRPRGDEVKGRSEVVSGDLSSMVEANLSQMLDAFSGDRIAVFEPMGRDDEDQAELESDVVSFYVMDDNPGYLVFQECIKDALILRNGFTKVWAETETKTRTREFEDVAPEAVAEIAARPEIEVLSQTEATLRLRETREIKRLRVRSVPVENVVYTENWTELDLQNIPLFGERHVDIRSELIEREGFPAEKVNELPPFIEHVETQMARNPRGEVQAYGTGHGDASLDQIEWYELYMLVDKDGDGIAERRRVSIVPNHHLLADEEADHVPYAAGAAILNPHRMLGISIYDKVKQTQDMRTGLKRALLDNADVSNKRQKVYLSGRVDEDDLASGEVNHNIRVRGVADARQAVSSLEVPDISAGILANLEYLAQERSELGGAALDLSQANAQLPDRAGSQGIDRAYSVMEQLASMMTRNMAETLIRNTYKLAHEVLRNEFDDPVEVKRRGRWISARPVDWPERSRLQVRPGMNPGERQRKQQALSFMLQSQLQMIQAGEEDTLVNAEGFYQALTDWGRAAEISNPEQYWIDPQSEESRQAADLKARQAAEQQQQQQRLMDMAVGLEQLKIGMDKYKTDMETTFKYWAEQLRSEVEEAKIVGEAVREQLEAARETSNESGNEDEG